MDLFLGHYSVREGEGLTVPCPLNNYKDWKYITVRFVININYFQISRLLIFLTNFLVPFGSSYRHINVLCKCNFTIGVFY